MQVAVARAEFAGAETAGAVALQMYRRSDYSFVPMLAYLGLAATRSARGDVAGADEALDSWLDAGGRSLAPYRLQVLASTGDPSAFDGARAFRPVGGASVNLFNLSTLAAQAEVAMAIDDWTLLADALGPLVEVYRTGVRWSPGWPVLLSRLLAGVTRQLGQHADAEQWCATADEEAAASGAAGELARVSLERARLARATRRRGNRRSPGDCGRGRARSPRDAALGARGAPLGWRSGDRRRGRADDHVHRSRGVDGD